MADGSGRDRNPPAKALALLHAAGYQVKDSRLVRDGQPLTFEILVRDRNQERLALNYAGSLRRIGVIVSVRQVDDVQYQRRRQKFDFDMMMGAWYASASPGNEQRTRWGSASATQEASFNLAGAQSPAIDAMIVALLGATSREDFITAVRAYDRVLLSGFYIVPLYHSSQQWFAAWTTIARPEKAARYGALFGATLDTWWRKSAMMPAPQATPALSAVPWDTLLRARAVQTPAAVALADGSGALSAADFDAACDAMACRFVTLGLMPGERVVLSGSADRALLTCLVGALRAGLDVGLAPLTMDAPSLIFTAQSMQASALIGPADYADIAFHRIMFEAAAKCARCAWCAFRRALRPMARCV